MSSANSPWKWMRRFDIAGYLRLRLPLVEDRPEPLFGCRQSPSGTAGMLDEALVTATRHDETSH